MPTARQNREVLLVGPTVVGWSTAAGPPSPARRPGRRLGRGSRLVLAGAAVALAALAAVLTRPAAARAPLVAPAVAAHEHALAARAAASARLHHLRQLEVAGIAGHRVAAPPVARRPRAVPLPRFVVPPSERAVALATYVEALGTDTILRGLDASRTQLEQQVLHDPRVHIYPGGSGDVASGRVDVRVLAIIEYLAQANGEVSVSCLISGHSYFVHGRPGVVSAHVYGRAADISAVGGVPIVGHQGVGTVTERAIRQMLALPASVEPVQIISLMTLGGPSFALFDHYNHIHVGY